MTEKSFRIITLGCKVNQYESAYLKESLIAEGWHLSQEKDKADITIINTCIVTQEASFQSRQAIRKSIRENPSSITAAVGCYAQVFPEDLSKIEGIHIIAGNREKLRLSYLLKKGNRATIPLLHSKDFPEETTFDYIPINDFHGRTRAFLKIQDGCESFCSYCIVPLARGPLRSLDPNRVIGALRSLSEADYKEVVITGIHLGKYGQDLMEGVGLRELLHRIGKEGLPLRIRLSSLEPNEIDKELIDLISSEEWLCPHVHIPLQSGDDEVLKKMNRRYTSKQFATRIERIHEGMPLAAIGVDVMAGFPGEDERAYKNTFSLIRDLPVSYLHVFPFSARKGTAASTFRDQVKKDLIKKRAKELRDLGKRKREAFYRSCLGKEFSVLAEGWHSAGEEMIRGLSENYLPVIFHSSMLVKNRLLKIRLEDIRGADVLGRSV